MLGFPERAVFQPPEREREIFPGRLDMLHCEPRSALQILNVWNLMRLMAHVRISGADGYLAKDVGYLG